MGVDCLRSIREFPSNRGSAYAPMPEMPDTAISWPHRRRNWQPLTTVQLTGDTVQLTGSGAHIRHPHAPVIALRHTTSAPASATGSMPQVDHHARSAPLWWTL